MRSSEQGIKDFKSDSTWLDIKEILESRVKAVRDLLENEGDMDTIKFHQGRINEMRVFIDLPDIILEELIEDKGVKDDK